MKPMTVTTKSEVSKKSKKLLYGLKESPKDQNYLFETNLFFYVTLLLLFAFAFAVISLVLRVRKSTKKKSKKRKVSETRQTPHEGKNYKK